MSVFIIKTLLLVCYTVQINRRSSIEADAALSMWTVEILIVPQSRLSACVTVTFENGAIHLENEIIGDVERHDEGQ